jgi:hypothetical protein
MLLRFAYLIVFLSTFIIGVSTVWLCSLLLQTSQLELTPPDESVLAITSRSKKRFNPTISACKPGWSQGYETSDGYSLFESGMGYSTPYLANGELRKLSRRAEEIIERATRLDKEGKKIGERIVAKYRTDSSGKEWVRIIWTEGAVLRTITAPSLELAKEFEKTQHDPY